MRIRQLMGDSQPDAAAPAAQIEHSALHAKALYRVYRRIDEYLGIHARNENIGCYRHRQTVKLP